MAMQQEHLLEVPTLVFRPKFQGISPQNMARNMVLTYLHFRILEFPLSGIYLLDGLMGLAMVIF